MIVPDVNFISMEQVGCEHMPPQLIPEPVVANCLFGFKNAPSVSKASGRRGAHSVRMRLPALHPAKREKTGRAQASPRRLSKWAPHEVRSAHLQAEHIRQHGFSQAHKLVEAAFFLSRCASGGIAAEKL